MKATKRQIKMDLKRGDCIVLNSVKKKVVQKRIPHTCILKERSHTNGIQERIKKKELTSTKTFKFKGKATGEHPLLGYVTIQQSNRCAVTSWQMAFTLGLQQL